MPSDVSSILAFPRLYFLYAIILMFLWVKHCLLVLMVEQVKVCDICGDAGREELLATCSKCTDGAEHM